MSLRRDCTLTVHVPEALGALDRPTLANACLGVVDKRQIKCIQVAGTYYRVTFASVEAKEAFASKGLTIKGVNVPLQAPDHTTLVRIVRLPYEVSEQSLAVILSPFGVVLSQSFEKDKNDGLLTGTRLVRMRLTSTVPNKLHVAGYPCFAWYPGQPKLCHVCRSSGHLVAECPNRGLCRICRKPGHVANKCPHRQPDEGNRPFAWGRAQGAPAAAPAIPAATPEDEGNIVDRDAVATRVDGENEEGEVIEVLEEGQRLAESETQDPTPDAASESLESPSGTSSQATPAQSTPPCGDVSSQSGPSAETMATPSESAPVPTTSHLMETEASNSSPPIVNSDGFITVSHQRKKSSSRGRQLISAVASLHSLERQSRTLTRSRIPTKKSSSSGTK